MNFTQQAGILHSLCNQPSESDMFGEVFSDEAFACMILETNYYAAEQIALLWNAGRLTPNSHASNWRDTDIAVSLGWYSSFDGVCSVTQLLCLLVDQPLDEVARNSADYDKRQVSHNSAISSSL